MNFLKLKTPKALKVGDSIALIRPSSRLSEENFKRTEDSLRRLGFCVVTYPKKLSKDSYFASSDIDRAKEFLWALREPGVRAILSCRGGYGAHRLFDAIQDSDWKKIQKLPPKIFVGYSDSTYLHQRIQNSLGWKTFHGPLAGFLNHSRMKKFLNDLLNLSKKPKTENWKEVQILRSGSARGLLAGGNLALIEKSGPASLPKKVPLILAIEDIGENFYRLDRMLRSIADAQFDIRGVVVGSLTKCGKDDAKIFGFKRLKESLLELTRGPIWINAEFGHGLSYQRILPLGARVSMKGKNTFSVLEAVVQ